MDRSVAELASDILFIMEGSAPETCSYVLCKLLVHGAKAVGLREDVFFNSVHQMFMNADIVYEDREVLPPVSDSEVSALARAINKRLLEFSPFPTMEGMSALLQCQSVLVRNGFPEDITLGMLKSFWRRTVVVTASVTAVKRPRDMNGLGWLRKGRL